MVAPMEDDGPAGSAHPGQIQFVIAGWSLEEEGHCLVRGHESVKLEPRTTRLLAHMARHAGEPLGREDLLGEVWSGVVVGDEALTTAINKIRRAFQDDRQNPRVIETIPKMGYRLIAPVQRCMVRAPREAGRSVQADSDGPNTAAAAVPRPGCCAGVSAWA